MGSDLARFTPSALYPIGTNLGDLGCFRNNVSDRSVGHPISLSRREHCLAVFPHSVPVATELSARLVGEIKIGGAGFPF